MSERIFDEWERAARMSTVVIRNELDHHMARLSQRILRADDLDMFGRNRAGSKARRKKPRVHPTKGYRGAHKLFRGGSR
jgi:hypothetical protein